VSDMTTSTLTTSVISGRIVVAIAVAGLVTAGVLGFLYSFDDPAAQWPDTGQAGRRRCRRRRHGFHGQSGSR